MTAPHLQKLSIVVPCFNEEENLKRFPEEVIGPLSKSVPDWEIVFIDDGSTDRTFHVMQDLQQKFPGILVRQHSQNSGLGSGLRTGFDVATGDAILTLDSDLTFHPRELPSLLAVYVTGVDCVMGSPFQGKMENVHLVRKFLSWGVNRLYALLLGRNFSSVSSIFRLMRSSKVKQLDLRCTSFDINAEVLYKLLAAGGKVVEVPVTLGKREFGVSKINVAREIKNHLKMFLKIIYWKVGLA